MLIGNYIAMYKNNTKGGFVNGHLYKIHIYKNDYSYIIEEICDLNDDKSENSEKKGYITYASEKSIRMYWDIQEDVTEL